MYVRCAVIARHNADAGLPRLPDVRGVVLPDRLPAQPGRVQPVRALVLPSVQLPLFLSTAC